MNLINQAFSGFLDVVKQRLKIGKKLTDIKEEAKAQNASSSNVSSNVPNYNLDPNHVELEIGDGSGKRTADVPYNNPSKNLKVEKYLDQEHLDG